MTQVLVDHLRQLQAGHIDGPKRGKRINIEPGKSVTAANLRQAKKNFHEELEKRKTQLSDSNDEDEPCNTDVLEPGERGFINQEDYEIGEASTALENIPENETNPNTFKVRDFVIGKYSTNKRDRLYLSQITEVVDNIRYYINLKKILDHDESDCFLRGNSSTYRRHCTTDEQRWSSTIQQPPALRPVRPTELNNRSSTTRRVVKSLLQEPGYRCRTCQGVVQNALAEAQLPAELLNPFYKNPAIAAGLAKESWFGHKEFPVHHREADKISRSEILKIIKRLEDHRRLVCAEFGVSR
ncbi:hypothetical protein QE152_g8785 [Popillia japonica]|uniref:Uncharacterized protein n=1 Tax=Popillia japonica TaxID=7064 RepID=A0AAW1M2R8_POPJA